MKLNTVMFVAAVGLAGTAFAGGDKDKHKDEGTSAQMEMEQPAKDAQQHAEKASEHADKAAQSAERAQEQEGMQAQQQPSAADEQAAEQEMEALMADEIERRVEAAEQAPEKRVFGKVIGVTQEQIILDIGGAALPVTVDRDTKIEGAAIPASKQIQAHIRSEFQPGQLISVTYDLKNMKNIALSIEELKAQPMGSEPKPSTGMEEPTAPMQETEPEMEMEPMPLE